MEKALDCDINGHEDYYISLQNPGETPRLPFGPKGMKRVERLGNFMKVLMKDDTLTKDMVELALVQAEYKGHAVMGIEALRLLCTVWTHGNKLIQVLPSWTEKYLNPERLLVIRALTQNQAHRFIHNPKNNGQNNIKILTTVLPTTELVDAFEKALTKSAMDRDSLLKWIPLLDLSHLQVPGQSGVYQQSWRQGVEELCAKARQSLMQQKARQKTKKIL